MALTDKFKKLAENVAETLADAKETYADAKESGEIDLIKAVAKEKAKSSVEQATQKIKKALGR